MAVDTDTQWATREEVQATQSQDRERIAKLEGQLGEYDKRLATKADLEKAIGSVQSDIRVLRIWLFVGLAGLAVLELAVPDDINLLDVLLQLRRLGGG